MKRTNQTYNEVDLGARNSKLGLEIELSYAPSQSEYARLKRRYCDEAGMCPTNLSYRTFFTLLMELSARRFENLFHRKPLADGGGIEFVLAPFTLRYYFNNRRRFAELLKFARDFTLYPSEKDGIHVNIDYSLLGANLDEQKKTLKKLLYFVSPLSDAHDYVQNFCAREHEASRNSDIYSMLNDPFRRLTSRELENVFKDTSKDILDSLGITPMCALNMCFGKEGRQCIEWRWFASTTNIKKLLEIVVFVHSLIIFVRINPPDKISLARYKRFTNKYYLWYKIRLLLGW